MHDDQKGTGRVNPKECILMLLTAFVSVSGAGTIQHTYWEMNTASRTAHLKCANLWKKLDITCFFWYFFNYNTMPVTLGFFMKKG